MPVIMVFVRLKVRIELAKAGLEALNNDQGNGH